MKAIIFTSPSPFLNISNATEIPTISSINGSSQTVDVMMVLSAAIASVGIIANFAVIIVFLNDKKLRRKIPNIFIIHQVSVRPIFTLTLLVFIFSRNIPSSYSQNLHKFKMNSKILFTENVYHITTFLDFSSKSSIFAYLFLHRRTEFSRMEIWAFYLIANGKSFNCFEML